jgi:hypothetical protein
MRSSNTETELDYLAERWLAIKDTEREVLAERLKIEDQILALCPAREEGSSSRTLLGGYKLKTIGKLSYKADLDALLTITAAWPAEYKPVKTEVKVDENVLKTIRATRPDLWRDLAMAVTVKPAKTNVTIEEK